MRSALRIGLVLCVAVAAGVIGAAATAAAPSPGGDIILQLTTSGPDTVTVVVRHARGGDLATDVRPRLTLTATGPGGRRVGPRAIPSPAPGRGYVDVPKALPAGRWTVVVTAAAPHAASVRQTVQIGPPPGQAQPSRPSQVTLPPSVAGKVAQDHGQPAASTAASGRGGGAWAWWAGVPAGALLLGMATWLGLARRRGRGTGEAS